MANSSLSIWMIILFFGAVFMFLFGYFNIYISKEDRLAAKHFRQEWMAKKSGEVRCITARIYLGRIIYLIFAGVIAISIFVFFVIEELSSFAARMGGGNSGTALAILVFAIICFFVDAFMLFLAFLGEQIAFENIYKKYRTFFHLKVKPPEEY